MLIQLHESHALLPIPGNQSDNNPSGPFNPNLLLNSFIIDHDKKTLLSDTKWWPILMALDNIYMPNAVAHISAFCRKRQGGSTPDTGRVVLSKYTLCNKMWILITPYGYIDSNYEQDCLYFLGGDTDSPYDELSAEQKSKDLTVNFWKKFFTNKLKAE